MSSLYNLGMLFTSGKQIYDVLNNPHETCKDRARDEATKIALNSLPALIRFAGSIFNVKGAAVSETQENEAAAEELNDRQNDIKTRTLNKIEKIVDAIEENIEKIKELLESITNNQGLVDEKNERLSEIQEEIEKKKAIAQNPQTDKKERIEALKEIKALGDEIETMTEEIQTVLDTIEGLTEQTDEIGEINEKLAVKTAEVVASAEAETAVVQAETAEQGAVNIKTKFKGDEYIATGTAQVAAGTAASATLFGAGAGAQQIIQGEQKIEAGTIQTASATKTLFGLGRTGAESLSNLLVYGQKFAELTKQFEETRNSISGLYSGIGSLASNETIWAGATEYSTELVSAADSDIATLSKSNQEEDEDNNVELEIGNVDGSSLKKQKDSKAITA